MSAEVSAVFYSTNADEPAEQVTGEVDNLEFWQDWLIDRWPTTKEKPAFSHVEMYSEGDHAGTYRHPLDVAMRGVAKASAYAALHHECATLRTLALHKFDATPWLDEGKRLIMEELAQALADASIHAAVCLESLAEFEEREERFKNL